MNWQQAKALALGGHFVARPHWHWCWLTARPDARHHASHPSPRMIMVFQREDGSEEHYGIGPVKDRRATDWEVVTP